MVVALGRPEEAEAFFASIDLSDRADQQPADLVMARAANRAAAEVVGLGEWVDELTAQQATFDLSPRHARPARTATRAAVEQGPQDGQAWFSLLLGRTALFEGRVASATRSFTEAASLYRAGHDFGPARWAMAGCLLAAAVSADGLQADRAAAALAEVPEASVRLMESDITRSLAWLPVAHGDLLAARRGLWTAADEAAASGQITLEASALHDLARLGEDPARLAYVEALATHDAVAMQEASAGFEAMGALLFAAEAIVAAAELHRAGGHPRQAVPCDRQAAALLERCEGARPPAVMGRAAADPVSRREREIALLAVAGMSSREIGAPGLSTRTFDNHLQRIYLKLGIAVTGRSRRRRFGHGCHCAVR